MREKDSQLVMFMRQLRKQHTPGGLAVQDVIYLPKSFWQNIGYNLCLLEPNGFFG